MSRSSEDRSGATWAAREHWQAALRSALSARATELAAAGAEDDTVARALMIALEAAKASGAWAEVAELARALEGHRRARATVPNLDSARHRRRPGSKRA